MPSDCLQSHFRRRFQPLVEERTAARSRWRRRHPGRDNRRAPNFPQELSELPSFGHWLRNTIAEEVASGAVVDPDALALSKFPSRFAKKYRSMMAYDTITGLEAPRLVAKLAIQE